MFLILFHEVLCCWSFLDTICNLLNLCMYCWVIFPIAMWCLRNFQSIFNYSNKKWKWYHLKLKYHPISKQCESTVHLYHSFQESKVIKSINFVQFFSYANSIIIHHHISPLLKGDGWYEKSKLLKTYFASMFMDVDDSLPLFASQCGKKVFMPHFISYRI